jgi:hypothetical protein
MQLRKLERSFSWFEFIRFAITHENKLFGLSYKLAGEGWVVFSFLCLSRGVGSHEVQRLLEVIII